MTDQIWAGIYRDKLVAKSNYDTAVIAKQTAATQANSTEKTWAAAKKVLITNENGCLDSYEATIEGWSAALDLRDKETEGHTQRVTEMTAALAAWRTSVGKSLAGADYGELLKEPAPAPKAPKKEKKKRPSP